MKRYLVLVVVCFLLLAALCTLNGFSQTYPNIEQVVHSNTKFAIDLYKHIKAKEGNIFFSPYSISAALALTYGGARGETAKQMSDVLHFLLPDEELHSAFAELQNKLNTIQQKENIQISSANSLWPMDAYPFLKEYLELAGKYYQTEITQVDYKTDPKEARRIINAWVESKTDSNIRDIISKPPGNLTRLILVNAIYFKGNWARQFQISATKEMPFYLNSYESIDVPMMYQTGDFIYGEDVIVQILEIPYTGNDISMVIVLPKETEGLKNIEEMLTIDSFEMWPGQLSTDLVDVYLPRFQIESQFDLKKMLQAMGMKDAFARGKANFSGMDGKSNWLYIQEAIHKAFIEVNEEGTEAAAATKVEVGCFPSGMEVLTSHGPRVIDAIDTGTRVYANDLSTGEWVLAKVLTRHTHQYEGDMITIKTGHATIRATGNHPFYVLKGKRLAARPQPRDVPEDEQENTGSGRWVEARDLKIGDVLKDKSGKGMIITGISTRHEMTVVYNLAVDGCHSYAVHQNGILVHNKGAASPEPVLFRADHPFLFLILDKSTGSILFAGRVSNPLVETVGDY